MNARAELVLHVLCVCVRLLSRSQAMRLLGITDEANFRRFVRDLVARGLVSEITVWAKPVPEMREPLFQQSSIHLGNLLGHETLAATGAKQHPSFGLVLSRARARWAGVSAVPTPCIVATRRTTKLYGVNRARLLTYKLQSTHDLAVAEVFVRSVVNQLIQVDNWVGEDAIDFGDANKRIDVQLQRRIEGKQQVFKLLEIVGADYSISKLLAIECEGKRLGVTVEFW